MHCFSCSFATWSSLQDLHELILLAPVSFNSFELVYCLLISGQGLDTKLIGVLMPGRGFFNFWTSPRYPHGANLIATILLAAFQRVQDAEGALPPVLFLQADNCGRENKNQIIFRLCAWLVQQGIFEEVQLMFLPVGHTHAQIDQRWSVFSQKLKFVDCLTPEHLKKVAADTFRQSDLWYETFDVEDVIDFDKIFTVDKCRVFSGHGTRRLGERSKRRLHMFRFHMDGGKACVGFKEFDTPGPWRGDWLHDKPIPVFKTSASIKLPKKLPVLAREVVPNVEQIQKKVEALDVWFALDDPDMAAVAKECNTGVAGRFNAKLLECPAWWRAWLDEEISWANSLVQKSYSTQWQFNFHKCSSLSERGQALLCSLEVLSSPVPAPQYIKDLFLFTVDDRPPKSFRFDPEEDLELGDIALCQFEKDGSTSERGWELCQVVNLHPSDRQIDIIYLEPCTRKERGDWSGDWWKRVLKEYTYVCEDTEVLLTLPPLKVTLSTVIWAGSLTSDGKIRATEMEPLLAAIRKREADVLGH